MSIERTLAWFLGISLIGFSTTGRTETAAPQQQIHAWAKSALVGEPAPQASPGPGLEVVRQDFSQLRLRQSVMNTPLKLGDTVYKHGLGTHSESRVAVRLRRPGKVFEAQAGVDNNYDTQGTRGSVVFVVASTRSLWPKPTKRSPPER